MPDAPTPVTHLLAGAAAGDAAAAAAILLLVYAQLRAAAARQLQAERAGHTLQPTALVHEAYLKLVGPRKVPWQNRAHFYAAAAQAMRRILIDHARARGARGGGKLRRSDFPDVAALACLESRDPEAVAVVRLPGATVEVAYGAHSMPSSYNVVPSQRSVSSDLMFRVKNLYGLGNAVPSGRIASLIRVLQLCAPACSLGVVPGVRLGLVPSGIHASDGFSRAP